MFRIKLTALDYPKANVFNMDDPKEYRELILWLEDQKIRQYKIEDRANLRAVNNVELWSPAYESYKHDLGCPKNLKYESETLSWLLGYAIKLEFGDHVEKYQSVSVKRLDNHKSNMPSIKSTNPFDNLDFSSKEFENNVRNLAHKFNVAYHPDHFLLLQSISHLIKNNFSVEALKDQVLTGKPYPIFENDGFGFPNNDLESAARVLRLVQIQNVRELQTVINETIVAVQNLTADPRTDTKLGKVGY